MVIFIKKASFLVLLIALFSVSVSAAGLEYRFMHNDHDALVLGTIEKIEEGEATICVVQTLVSARDLNENAPWKQINPETVIVKAEDLQYNGIYSNRPPVEGDHFLVSVKKKKGDHFIVYNGAYLVDSEDMATLNVLVPEDAVPHHVLVAASVKSFANSGGENTEFVYGGYSGEEQLWLKKDNGERELIFEIEDLPATSTETSATQEATSPEPGEQDGADHAGPADQETAAPEPGEQDIIDSAESANASNGILTVLLIVSTAAVTLLGWFLVRRKGKT